MWLRAAEACGRGHGPDQPGHETGWETPDWPVQVLWPLRLPLWQVHSTHTSCPKLHSPPGISTYSQLKMFVCWADTAVDRTGRLNGTVVDGKHAPNIYEMFWHISSSPVLILGYKNDAFWIGLCCGTRLFTASFILQKQPRAPTFRAKNNTVQRKEKKKRLKRGVQNCKTLLQPVACAVRKLLLWLQTPPRQLCGQSGCFYINNRFTAVAGYSAHCHLTFHIDFLFKCLFVCLFFFNYILFFLIISVKM